MTSPTYPTVNVELIGRDGNVFAIIGAVTRALRREVSPEVADNWAHNAMSLESYDDVLRFVMQTVQVH